MEFKIYNSYTRKKEIFIPANPNKVTMYACGPTVYGPGHIGNGRSAIVFDCLARVLRFKFDNLVYARNITDIDDKIINVSKREKVESSVIAKKFTKQYHDDFKKLYVLAPDIEPFATNYIDQMIKFIDNLLKNNSAYLSDSHVLFNVSNFPDYGKLSGRKIEEMKPGARIEVASYKKNPSDFVLWKPSPENEIGWDSPWGRGRPGWHLECSAMIKEHLGETIDIHGGGEDLTFPHHENEIAQSCCNNSTEKFSNYWVHNGFVTINKEKMSKSLGNIVTISDAVNRYSGQVVRLALLSAHYSQPLDWNEKLLEDQKATIEKWYQLYNDSNEEISLDIIETLLDDLNSPGFIAKIHELYASAKKGDSQSKKNFNSACKFIGLFNLDKNEWENFKKIKTDVSETFILKKIKDRLNAKKIGDYNLADKIRNELLSKGIVIEDQKGKTIWKFK